MNPFLGFCVSEGLYGHAAVNHRDVSGDKDGLRRGEEGDREKIGAIRRLKDIEGRSPT